MMLVLVFDELKFNVLKFVCGLLKFGTPNLCSGGDNRREHGLKLTLEQNIVATA